MKALVYTANGRVELQTLDDPVPQPDEAVLRVRESGVCGSDVHGFLGKSKKRVPPLILGHEMSGEVAAVGSKVTDLKPGTRVAVMPLMTCGTCPPCRLGRTSICEDRKLLGMTRAGGFAEYVAAPRTALVPVPDGLDLLPAAMAEPLATPVNLFENHVRGPVGTVAIWGAGTLGLMALQVARAKGASRVFSVDMNDARLATARKLGASDTINARGNDPVRAILDATGGRGCDVTVDAAGFSASRKQGLAAASRGGVLGLIGNSDVNTEFDCTDIINREVEIHGIYGYTLDTYRRALEIIATGKVDVRSWITPFPLEDGQKVMDRLAGDPGDLVKAAFRP